MDESLKVIVEQAEGTLILFDPSKRHATTIDHGARNLAMTIAFSRRIQDALQELQNKGLVFGPNGIVRGVVEAADGAGEGNPRVFDKSSSGPV